MVDSWRVSYISPDELKPNPLNSEIYEKHDDSELETSILKRGIKQPLVVTPGNIIRSGHRRWRIAKKHGLKCPVLVVKSDDEKLDILDYNLYRVKTARELYNESIIRKDLLEQDAKLRMLSGKKADPVPDLTQGRVRSQVARDIGVSSGQLHKITTVYEVEREFPQVVRRLDAGEISVHRAFETIKRLTEESQTVTPEGIFKPKPFTVWNFSGCDPRFGRANFPGRTPGQLVQNLLHYYTLEGDLVVDPMAGSGTIHDVCQVMNRECLSYDLVPIRPFIKRHNVTQGFPEGAHGCNLIFLDPPYWKKMGASGVDGSYDKESVSSMSREGFLAFIEKLAFDCYETLAPKGVATLLISDYIDGSKSLLTCEYYTRFISARFKPINRIQCPLSNQQYKGHAVERALEEGRLLNIARDLYIFRKEGA